MPRMYRQPEAIGRMIRRRRAARERRMDKVAYATETIRDLQAERLFERSLTGLGAEQVFDDFASWGEILAGWLYQEA